MTQHRLSASRVSSFPRLGPSILGECRKETRVGPQSPSLLQSILLLVCVLNRRVEPVIAKLTQQQRFTGRRNSEDRSIQTKGPGGDWSPGAFVLSDPAVQPLNDPILRRNPATVRAVTGLTDFRAHLANRVDPAILPQAALDVRLIVVAPRHGVGALRWRCHLSERQLANLHARP